MRRILIISIFLFATLTVISQTANIKYNKAMADSMGADEFGMKNYILIILKTGTKQLSNKDSLNILFKAHMENINKMVENKKLIIAGPFGKNDNSFRGLFVFDVKTKEEALELLKNDPTIEIGIFIPEVYNWYGSAALPEYLKYCDMITNKKY